MGNFKRNRGFGGGKKFGGRDGGRPDMHKATCGECGVSCEVPFRPTGERPVYCSNCFRSQDDGGGRPNRSDDRRHERPNFENKQRHDGGGNRDSGEVVKQLNLLNSKIDKLIEVLTSKAKKEVVANPPAGGGVKETKTKTKAKATTKKSPAKKKK